MPRKYALILLSSAGYPIRQVNLTTRSITILVLFGMGCLTTVGFLGYKYVNLIQQQRLAKTFQVTAARQGEIISSQRCQIEKFAGEINILKEKLIRLDNFEKQIRIMANIDKFEEGDNLFGKGGSIPDDLDPGSGLANGHTWLVREMHEQVKQLNYASLNKERELQNLLRDVETRRNLLAATPSIRPADGWITSGFGYRESPFSGKRELHKGLDIANRKGTPIQATADGVVVFAGRRGSLGNLIVIDHGHGLKTRYAHISKALKQSGEYVKRGDIIAQMGSTGRSTGPHLHYEVYLNGVPVNPAKYIPNDTHHLPHG
jgi:murein DD-endopeptidase MepM/ murein hydrolase activator NlpD